MKEGIVEIQNPRIESALQSQRAGEIKGFESRVLDHFGAIPKGVSDLDAAGSAAVQQQSAFGPDE